MSKLTPGRLREIAYRLVPATAACFSYGVNENTGQRYIWYAKWIDGELKIMKRWRVNHRGKVREEMEPHVGN